MHSRQSPIKGLVRTAGCCALLIFGPTTTSAPASYSPPVANPYPERLYWGDTHLHTNLSADAFASGGNREFTPEKAYRFARGETVSSQTGIAARLARPLDFLLISDHAEFLGLFPKAWANSPDFIDTPLGQRWTGFLDADTPEKVMMDFGLVIMGALDSGNLQHLLEVPAADTESVWKKVGEVADAFNEPGQFTAFIGYEWTSTPDGNNLHRNVLFRDGANTTSKIVPYPAIDGRNPEGLWSFLAEYEKRTGGHVLAIPHNGNLSNGLMFADTLPGGAPLSPDYAQRRARWEPIIEVTQMKGDGEAHPWLSPNDEFADFESWDKGNLAMITGKQNAMLEYEYARSALKNGLVLEQSLGTNPYAFGMIGSTDSHTGLSTADDSNFFGKVSKSEPKADRSEGEFAPGSPYSYSYSESVASGYAAIWARENTREALFDAMLRREVYATTGPRIAVRFFGGWSFTKIDHERSDLAYFGYHQGVPMGSQLPPQPGEEAPSFLVSTLKDPIGANLDRIQIVKGWVDLDGQTHEQVYNVAASDNREIRNNKLKPVGNTVTVNDASYRNSIGDTALSTVWRDPDFDPELHAFYYVRVLEIPTPRWTTIDARVLGSKLPEEVPASIQERAYTSPIWYRPPASKVFN